MYIDHMNDFRDNVARVRERVEAALERSGRAGVNVTIVAVTKTFGPEVVNGLLRAGIKDIGENRLQEFLVKREGVVEDCRWHLVGHLQSNKARKAAGQFYRIQSIDSLRIAEVLNRLGAEMGVVTSGYVQINTSKEVSKHGFDLEEAVEGAAAIDQLEFVKIEGLMTIGPMSMDEKETRRCFKALYRAGEEINRVLGRTLPELSMGMSGDFETAIEEGATVVRLGRILTGERTGGNAG